MRLLVIGILSIVLFFPCLMFVSLFIGDKLAEVVSAFMMYVGFPIILLKFWKTYPPIDVVAVDIDDPMMQTCMARARAKLPYFIEGLKRGEKEAFIKYPVRTEGESIEHIWGLAHSADANTVVVSRMHDTVENLSAEESLRQKVAFENIEDWMLVDANENCEGGYTHLALYEAYKKEYGKFPKAYLPYLETFEDIDFENGRLR